MERYVLRGGVRGVGRGSEQRLSLLPFLIDVRAGKVLLEQLRLSRSKRYVLSSTNPHSNSIWWISGRGTAASTRGKKLKVR